MRVIITPTIKIKLRYFDFGFAIRKLFATMYLIEVISKTQTTIILNRNEQ